MGGPGKAHHENTEKLQDRPLLFGGCYFSQLYDRKFEIAEKKLMQERLRPISPQPERCLDKSAEMTERRVTALQTVASSPCCVSRPI